VRVLLLAQPQINFVHQSSALERLSVGFLL